jgi:hypothetical protein
LISVLPHSSGFLLDRFVRALQSSIDSTVMTTPLPKYGIYEFATGEQQETEQQQDEPPDGGTLPVTHLPMRFGLGGIHRVDRFTPGRIKWTIFAVRASEAVAASERRQTQQQ